VTPVDELVQCERSEFKRATDVFPLRFDFWEAMRLIRDVEDAFGIFSRLGRGPVERCPIDRNSIRATEKPRHSF
jgi:hypothetical protein